MESSLIDLLEERCKRSGNFGPVAQLVHKFEERIKELESDNCDRLTSMIEADALRQLLADERRKHAELRKMYEALVFRTTYQITCQLTEDTVPDNSELSVDQQAQVIMSSFNLGEIPGRPVETQSLPTRKEAVAALENQVIALRQNARQVRTTLLAQVTERLFLKRALDSLSGNTVALQKEVDDQRKALNRERESNGQQILELKRELSDAKDHVVKAEQRLAAEISAAHKAARTKEDEMSATIQNLQVELERLRTVERRLLRTENELDLVRQTAQELRQERNADAKKVSEIANTVRAAVLSELKKCATNFDALPLQMKMGNLTSRSTASSDIANRSGGLSSTEATDALNEDLREHFEALNATTAYIGKLLEEKVPEEVLTRVTEERERLSEIQSQRKKVNALLFRLDPKELGEEVSAAVDEFVQIERNLKKVRNSVRRSVTASVAVADVSAELENAMAEASEGQQGADAGDAEGDWDDRRVTPSAALLGLSDDPHQDDPNLTEFDQQHIPELDGPSINQRRIEALMRSTSDVGLTEAQRRSSIIAGHMSDPSSKRQPTATNSILASLAAYQQRNAMSSSQPAPHNTQSNNVVERPQGLRLPPLQQNKDETRMTSSKMFAGITKFVSEVAVARDQDASDVIRKADEERMVNLRICLSVLENAQKEYAKSKGVRLPPLESVEVESDCDIGRARGRIVGGNPGGKLVKHSKKRKASKAVDSPPVKLSVKPNANAKTLV